MKKFKMILLCVLVFALSVVSLFNVSQNDIEVKAETQPTLSIYKNNLSYSSELYLAYAVSYEGIDVESNEVELLFFDSVQTEYIKGNESYAVLDSGTASPGGVPCLLFYSNGISAKNMTDDIYSVAYVKVGEKEYYSEVNKFSVLEYAYKLMETGTELQVKLMKAMLEYGAFSKEYL